VDNLVAVRRKILSFLRYPYPQRKTKMTLFHFIWAGLGAKFGRAEVTMEGLAFPNRPSREPLAPRMSEPEPDKRRGQRGGEGLPGLSMNRGASSAGAKKAEEGTAVKT